MDLRLPIFFAAICAANGLGVRKKKGVIEKALATTEAEPSGRF